LPSTLLPSLWQNDVIEVLHHLSEELIFLYFWLSVICFISVI
jgi:hypothetical protein